jgi:hypothetical protein
MPGLYCGRCGIVLNIQEQRIGYCRQCDVPRLLEEIRDRNRRVFAAYGWSNHGPEILVMPTEVRGSVSEKPI